MKRFIFALVALSAAVTAAEAQRSYSPSNPPYDLWCRDVRDGTGTWPVCMAYTYQQCMASRYSPGERCYLNPRYDPRFQRR